MRHKLVDYNAPFAYFKLVLMATSGKIPKDRSWKQAKMMMAKVDTFLDALINYDKENIHSEIIKVSAPFRLHRRWHASV